VAQAPRTQPLQFDNLEEALGVLRAHGLRVSASRRVVLQGLFAAGGLVTAEQLADGLGGTSTVLDVSVVYRNLETLEALGLVRHVHLGHGPGRYAIAVGGGNEYLACERCGAVLAVSPEELEPIRREIRERFGYEARFTHFPITGVCASCSSEVAVA
jgi:Fur family ferric uptake transcriptional regulator